MPKVRASSGTIGTTYFPIRSCLSKRWSIRTIDMVVDTSRPLLPSVMKSKNSRSGGSIGGKFTSRCGMGPPRRLLRSCK